MSNNENNIIHIQNNVPVNVDVQPSINSHNIDIHVIQNFHAITIDSSHINNIDVHVTHHNISVDIIDNRLIYNVYNGDQSAPDRSVKSIYATYYVTNNDDILLVYPTSSHINIILPSATTHTNKTLTFKRKAGGYNVQITTIGNQTIDDETSYVLQFKNESITIISDNNNWCII